MYIGWKLSWTGFPVNMGALFVLECLLSSLVLNVSDVLPNRPKVEYRAVLLFVLDSSSEPNAEFETSNSASSCCRPCEAPPPPPTGAFALATAVDVDDTDPDGRPKKPIGGNNGLPENRPISLISIVEDPVAWSIDESLLNTNEGSR